ncbi:unnamed protein product [Chrysoparadoxa australica]
MKLLALQIASVLLGLVDAQGPPEQETYDFGKNTERGWKNWATNLDPADFPVNFCGDTARQSPINLREPIHTCDFQAEDLSYLITGSGFTFDAGDCTYAQIDSVKDAVANFQVNFPASGCTLPTLTAETDAMGGTTVYTLLQFHFHSKSEHTIDGKRFGAEVHLVHADLSDVTDPNGDGLPDNLLVIGINFEGDLTSDAPILGSYFDTIAAVKGGDALAPELLAAPFLPYDLIPSGTQFYSYLGSLTTPPCSEAVTWVVAAEPRHMSAAQLSTLRTPKCGVTEDRTSETGDTFRGIQPLNGRNIYLCNGFAPPAVAPVEAS